MKKQILSFLFVMSAVVLISTSAFAQPSTPQQTTSVTALDGSTVTYTVTALTGATYHWILSGGSTTNDVPAQPAGLLNKNSVSITWNTATAGSVYNLDVYVVDANGCYSEMKRTAITINKATINIDASQTATTCSYLAGEGIKGNATTPANDSFTITTTSDGGITPASITYDIFDTDGTTVLANRSASVNLLTGSFDVNLDGVFANTSGSDKTFTIKLNSATDSASNPMNVGTTSASITIHSIPVISF